VTLPAVLTALALVAVQAAAPQVRRREQVEVERILVEARVVDGHGQPVLGLAPEHFRVSLAFSTQALRRVEGALAGHYVLILEAPRLGDGSHDLRVRLVGRRGVVLAPPSWQRRGGG
jgi:hypothetical protein